MVRNTQRSRAWAEQPPCRPEFQLAGLSSVSTWRSGCQQVVTVAEVVVAEVAVAEFVAVKVAAVALTVAAVVAFAVIVVPKTTEM